MSGLNICFKALKKFWRNLYGWDERAIKALRGAYGLEVVKVVSLEEKIEKLLHKNLMTNFMGDMKLKDKELDGEETIKFVAKAIASMIEDETI